MRLAHRLLTDAILDCEPLTDRHAAYWADRYLDTPAGRALAAIIDAVEDATDCECQQALFRARLLAAPDRSAAA